MNKEDIIERMDVSLSSSYHGANCRTCNRNPSYLRRVYWRLEDIYWRILKWYYKEESTVYTLEDYFKEDIERDIRLWVPPKRRRPAKVKYIRKMKVIE